jgi:hypothetical protein
LLLVSKIRIRHCIDVLLSSVAAIVIVGCFFVGSFLNSLVISFFFFGVIFVDVFFPDRCIYGRGTFTAGSVRTTFDL